MSLRKPSKSGSSYVRHGKAPFQYSDALLNWRKAAIAQAGSGRLEDLRRLHDAYVGRLQVRDGILSVVEGL